MTTALLAITAALAAVATALCIHMFRRDDAGTGLVAVIVMLLASVTALGYSAADG